MKRSLLFVLLAGIAGFLLVQWLHSGGFFEQWEQLGNDWRFRQANATWQPQASSAQHNDTWVSNQNACRVVIVALDETSEWPLDEARWQRLHEQLHTWGAAAFGVDLALEEETVAALGNGLIRGLEREVGEDASPTERQAAQQQREIVERRLRELPVVLAEQPYDGVAQQVALPEAAPVSWAAGGLFAERDGVVRRAHLTSGGKPSFAYELASLAAPERTGPSWHEQPHKEVLLAYAGPPEAVPRISLSDVLADDIPETVLQSYGVRDAGQLLGNRVVLLGATSPGLHLGPAGAEAVWGVRTPYYNSREARSFLAERHGLDPAEVAPSQTRMPAIEVQANAVQMFTQPPGEVAIQPASAEHNGALLVAACLVMVLAVAFLPPLFSFLILVTLGVGLYVGTTSMLVEQRIFYSMLAPMLGATITFAFGTLASYVVERRERRYITEMFSKYLSPQVVKQMAASKEPPKLGGENRELTLLFSDLQGFTSWSERLGPERLLELLNEYLGAMTEVIFKHQGTLDKFMGDAVMAFWNAPIARKHHEQRACEAALAMIDRLDELNLAWQATGLEPLTMRIGIHTGAAVVGNAGSGERFDYTAFGDSVNLASRLEGTAKIYGVSCVISAATYEGAGGEARLLVRQLDRVRVVGRQQPVDIYELLGTAREGKEPGNKEYMRFLKAFREGMAAYQAGEFSQASTAFKAAQKLRPEDTPTKILLARIQRFAKQPPPQNWDGSVELPRK